MTTKQPNEIELTAERMKEAWNAQRELPRSENTRPKFDPTTDKTDWVVSAFYIGAPKAKGGKAKKAKPATAEPQEAPEPVAEEVEA